MMEVVSPTSVAAPCRFEETEMVISMGTGEVFSFLQIASATGAIISTVATLSTKALTAPAKRLMDTAAHCAFLHLDRSRSAMRLGILESMKSATVPMVPASISSTFQSMASAT